VSAAENITIGGRNERSDSLSTTGRSCVAIISQASVQLSAGLGGRTEQHRMVFLPTTAAEVGLSTSAVRHNLHRLEQCGLIRLKSRYSAEGARLTNKITML